VIAKLAKVSTLIVDCFACFYLGGLSSMFLESTEKMRYKTVYNFAAVGAIVIVPMAAYVGSIYHYNYSAFLLLMVYVPILLYVCAKYVSVPLVATKMIEAAGNMTYSSYLIHFPIQLLIALYFMYTNQDIPRHSSMFFSGFVLVTLVASYYVYRFFEMPAQTFIRSKFL
jgi:peptidoglycan/LPS O-acetylase OafA/YrhL